MRRFTIAATAAFAIAGTVVAFTDEGNRRFHEFLNGFNEAAAVVSTTGSGTFEARIVRNPSSGDQEIRYRLTFKDLEGDVRQAHIHIGWPQNAGGIVLWLCDSDQNPSPTANTPACNGGNAANNREGSAEGTLTEADVRDLPANGIAGAPTTTPGEFAEVIALIRAGRTYVNVHSVKFPPGEIRSQIDNRNGDRDDNDGHGDHGDKDR
jgi:CHRD domain